LHGAVFDLAGAERCAALVAQFPEVDILVNNVGFYQPKAFFEIEDGDWMRMFEVNVDAKPEEIANLICYLCCKASSATNGAALRADGGIVTNPF
jgi:NAD(P)-dependent dehydrogenase (short-subunit alcohol dehydrogenase family)